MPGAGRLLAAMIFGLCYGIIVAVAVRADGLGWPALATMLRDITTAAGLLVGGWWAYHKYFRQRESEPRADLEHHIMSVDVDGQLLLRVTLEIKNVGPVEIGPAGGETLIQVPPTPLNAANEDPHKQWVTVRKIEYPFRVDDLCIEPNATERYCRDVILDPTVRVVQIHSRVFCSDNARQWDETTVHELKPKPASVPVAPTI